MARIRTIKPEFPQSESMGRVSREARLCFILLWTLADDAGRLRGNSKMLASLLYPYDADAPKLIDRWLEELQREDCIIRYRVDGNLYIEVCKWLTHQKIDKPSPSKIDPFTPEKNVLDGGGGGGERIREDSRGFANPLDPSQKGGMTPVENPREDSRDPAGMVAKPRERSCEDLDLDLDQGRDQGKDQGPKDQGFEVFWDGWPRRRRGSKGDARKAWKVAVTKLAPERILAAAAEYAGSPVGKGEFVKGPAPWLNQECWDDDRQAWGIGLPIESRVATAADVANYNPIDGGLGLT